MEHSLKKKTAKPSSDASGKLAVSEVLIALFAGAGAFFLTQLLWLSALVTVGVFLAMYHEDNTVADATEFEDVE